MPTPGVRSSALPEPWHKVDLNNEIEPGQHEPLVSVGYSVQGRTLRVRGRDCEVLWGERIEPCGLSPPCPAQRWRMYPRGAEPVSCALRCTSSAAEPGRRSCGPRDANPAITGWNGKRKRPAISRATLNATTSPCDCSRQNTLVVSILLRQ